MEVICPDKKGFLNANEGKIYYEYFGKGKKEVFVFMNGVAMYAKSWYNFINLIYPEYDLLLYDFLGQGDSDAPQEPYSIENFCHYLNQILDELEIPKIHLMGISYGALVAADFARLYQNRLMTLTLSGGFLTRSENFLYGTELAKQLLVKGDFDSFGKLVYSKIFSDNFIKNMRQYFDAMNNKLYERYKDKIYALINLIDTQFDFVDKLEKNLEGYKSIKTPTLIIAGKQDVVTPPDWLQNKITEIIPNTRMELIDDCAHVVYIEKSSIFFDLLKKFAKNKSLAF